MSLPYLPSNFSHWIKVLSKFVSVQIIVQALTLVSGIWIVRTLDKQEYAYYTMGNSMLATMNMLADSGISIGLSALGGKVWQDRHRFGQLINTAMKLRYFLAAISVTVVTPILMSILIRNGASIGYVVLITILVILGLNFQLTNGVLMIVPRLHSQIRGIQNLDILSTSSRLVLLGLGYLTFWNAAVAIACASLVQGLQRFILVRWTEEKIDLKAPINREDRKFIIRTIKNALPSTIFFCIQGQIGVYLISIFGKTESIAEIGALGRIAVIFTIINSVMATIVLPSFARCQSVVMLKRRYFQILGVFLLLGVFIIAVSFFFSSKLLWILGNQYNNLGSELFLMIIGITVSSLNGIMSSINLSKAWIEYVWIDIPISLFWQAILLINLDISTVHGVLIFGLLSTIPPLLVNLMLTYRGFANYNKSF